MITGTPGMKVTRIHATVTAVIMARDIMVNQKTRVGCRIMITGIEMSNATRDVKIGIRVRQIGTRVVMIGIRFAEISISGAEIPTGAERIGTRDVATGARDVAIGTRAEANGTRRVVIAIPI